MAAGSGGRPPDPDRARTGPEERLGLLRKVAWRRGRPPANAGPGLRAWTNDGPGWDDPGPAAATRRGRLATLWHSPGRRPGRARRGARYLACVTPRCRHIPGAATRCRGRRAG